MRSKKLGILLSVAMIVGLLAAMAVPASAVPEGDDLRSYAPNVNAGNNLLTDRFDGTDTLVHLTAVSSPTVTHTDWVICALDAAAGAGPNLGLIDDPAELAQCTVEAGSDTTPNQLPGAGGVFPTSGDLAWDVTFDVPSTLDASGGAGARDVLVAACVGAGRTLFGGGKNCVQDYVEDVFLDDTATPPENPSAGEITDICTTAPVATECTIAGGDPRADIDARFTPFEHGDVIPNDGVTLRATTDTEPTSVDLQLTLANAALTPGAAGAGTACVLIDTTATFKRWECTVDPVDNTSLAAHLVLNDGAASTNVAFPRSADIEATFSVARAATSVVASFDPELDGPAVCADPDTEETNALGDVEDIWGCVFDQFGDGFTPTTVSDVSFESGGVAGAEVFDCDVEQDPDADGLVEICTENAPDAGPGQYVAVASNELEEGDQTITFCVDPEGDGCANAAAGLTTTITKTWVSIADTVFLIFDGTSDDTTTPFSTCTTGDTFKENETGDSDPLLACTFDAVGLPAPVPATTDKPNGGRLQWFIAPSGGGELTATRFAAPPPTETGADARAVATIEAFRAGNDIITVELQSEIGDFLDSANVQKRVTQGAQVACEIQGTGGADNLVGTNQGETICAKAGADTVKAKKGADTVKGGKGKDNLKGGAGRDTIIGGKGRDTCIGGKGQDTFKSCENKQQ